MKIPDQNRHPLLKEYWMLAIATSIIVVMILSYSLIAFRDQKASNASMLRTEAKIIESTISESFDYANQINNYIGRQIVDNKKADLNFILKLFHKAEKIQNKNSELLSWSSFDWVDKNNFMVVNSRLGIIKNQIDMSERKYIVNAPKNPWTLQLSSPAMGKPSNIWVIPAGTGVVDENGKFFGIISSGFNISEFTEKLEKRLTGNISFVILDKDLNIVMQSSDNKLDKESDFYKKNFVIAKPSESFVILKKPINVGDIRYTAYHQFDKYPYIALVGFNQSFLNKEFNNLILPRILEFIGLIIFFLIILYLFEAKIISLLKTERKLKDSLTEANLARTNLIKSLSGSFSHELRSPLATIRGGISVVRINLEQALGIFKMPGSADIKESKIDQKIISMPLKDVQECLEYLNLCDNVIDQGNMIIDLTLEKIHDKPLDKNRFLPSSILETVNQAIRQYAFKPDQKEKIIIQIDARKDDFTYLGIKEVMLFVLFNLLKNALYYAAGKKDFQIVIYTSKDNKWNNLHFKDNGPGVLPEILPIMFDNFTTAGKMGGVGLGLAFCKRVMDDFSGKIECVSKPNEGAEFILSFPLVK